jgi:type I restriction enzyme S subunit
MNAKRLLAHYERIADAPDAIARLRRFILDLAVRGKLVPQEPKDEPASVLLKRVAAESARLVKAEAIRRDAELIPVSGSKFSFPLPAGWACTTLGSVANITMGQSPPGDTYNRSGVGVPLINGPAEFSVGPFGKAVVSQYTTAPTNFCEEGDFLICVRGSTTGRTNVAGFRACIGRGVAAIRCRYDDAFIRLFIWSMRDAIIDMGRGIAFPSVSRKQIEELALPVPPLAEQHRIVAKVDGLMALADQIEAARAVREARRDRLTTASLARLNAANPDTFQDDARFALDALPAITARSEHVKQLRQTILNLAVRGKLVPQDPNDESVTEWLRRSLGRDAAKGIEKAATEVFLPWALIDSSYTLPLSWLWMPLGKLVTVMDAGWSPQCENHPRSDASKWGVLRTTSVQPLAFDCTQHKELPGKFPPRPRLEARIGDILVTRAGPKNRVGISCVVDKCERRLMISDKLIRFRLLDDLEPRFFALTLNAGISSECIEAAKSGMAVMQMNISQDKLRLVPVPLPTVAEQRRIVAKVDELMTLCERLEAGLAAGDDTRSRLLDSLLAEALASSKSDARAAEELELAAHG